MFDTFEDFKKDFMEKIGKVAGFGDKEGNRWDINKRRNVYKKDPTVVSISQSRTTATRGWGENSEWSPCAGEYDEDYSIMMIEIIEAVQHFYQVGTMLTNRFIRASEGLPQNDWITTSEDPYSDYYDCGVTQILEVDLKALFDLIKDKNSN